MKYSFLLIKGGKKIFKTVADIQRVLKIWKMRNLLLK